MDEEEISENQAITKYENTYDIDDYIFNPTEIAQLIIKRNCVDPK